MEATTKRLKKVTCLCFSLSRNASWMNWLHWHSQGQCRKKSSSIFDKVCDNMFQRSESVLNRSDLYEQKAKTILSGTAHVRMNNKKNKNQVCWLEETLDQPIHSDPSLKEPYHWGTFLWCCIRPAFWQVQKQAETLSPRSPKSPRSPALSARVGGPGGWKCQAWILHPASLLSKSTSA